MLESGNHECGTGIIKRKPSILMSRKSVVVHSLSFELEYWPFHDEEDLLKEMI